MPGPFDEDPRLRVSRPQAPAYIRSPDDARSVRGMNPRRTSPGFLAFAGAGVLGVLGLLAVFLWSVGAHGAPGRVSDDVLRERTGEIRGAVQRIFAERLASLDDATEQIERALAVSDGHGDLFNLLGEWSRKISATVEVVDSAGTPVAWAGRSARSRSALAPSHEQGRVFHVVSRNGVFTYLTSGRWDEIHRRSVLVSIPLENELPAVVRFLPQEPLAVAIAAVAPGFVEIDTRSGIPDSTSREQLRIPLQTPERISVATAVVAAPTRESIAQERTETGFWWARLFAVAVFTSLTGLLTHAARRLRPSALAVSARISLLWMFRCGLLAIGVPAAFGIPVLTDAAVFGSPFGWGLAASPAELILSAAALLGSVLIAVRWTRGEVYRSEGIRGRTIHPLVRWGTALACGVLFVLLVRALAAIIRSVVLDSTLAFQDATTLVPDLPLLLIFTAIVLISVSFFGVLLTLVEWMIYACTSPGMATRALAHASTRSPAHPSTRTVVELLVVLLLVGLSIVLLRVWEDTALWPWPVPLCAALACFSVLLWEARLKARGGGHEWGSWRVGISWLIGAFAVVAPIFAERVVERDHQQAESMANDLLRPVDSWISFVLTDGLRSAVSSLAQREEGVEAGPSSEGLAFDLWSASIMSRQDYNSGIVVYDATGKEMDRFVVGIGSYDQRAMLGGLFDHEEETLQSVERPDGRGRVKHFGIWSTVRQPSGTVIGSIAVLIEEANALLGEARDSNPLRRPAHGIDLRAIYVTELQDSAVSVSSRPDLFEGARVPGSWAETLNGGSDRSAWIDEELDGRRLETYLAHDPQVPGRTVAVSIPALDIRWHAFTVLKLFIAFFCLILLMTLLHLGRRIRRQEGVMVTYGQRLFVAFAVIAIVPLVILGYYNRDVARMRVEAGLSRSLERDLGVIERRIVSSVTDEEDFIHGITDEFCRAVGSEYDMDFAVYRGREVQASTRPELYRAALFDRRLDGIAYRDALVDGRTYSQVSEEIGQTPYAVGFMPITLGGRRIGVVAIPTIYRQRELDEEIAERNVGVFGIYAMVLAAALMAGGILASRFADPILALSAAAREVGRGKFDIDLPYSGSDEIGALTASFREMAQELARSRNELAAAERERAWREMAKQVAHEIRNPLTPMKLSIQHLRQAFRDGAPDREEILRRVTQTVLEQVETLSRIATEFSHFARMPDARFERVDLHALLDEAAAVFAEVEGVRFVWPRPAAPAMILADRDQMRRVFINMFRNSIQAMTGGGTVTLETVLVDRMVVIRIRDTGPGIPEHILSRIFEPNFSTKTEGMGIGLAIAKKAVEDAGGTIRCESRPGSGTLFEIMLPVSA